MGIMYRGMVRKVGDTNPPVPMKWTGEVYYTDNRDQLEGMLQHMKMYFPQNEYTLEGETF